MSEDYKYNTWPLGLLKEELRRKEPEIIKSLGYEWSDAREIVDIFEGQVAEFTGAKYAVTLDCASHGIFLLLKYIQFKGVVSIPKHTYASVPMQILHSGNLFELTDERWFGEYQLKPTQIFDSAGRFKRGMYRGGKTFQVLSFQIKKNIPIGRGGAILTDSLEAYSWLKRASYDGRNLKIPYDDENHIESIGWHYYMTPEDAARGLILMHMINENTFQDLSWELYPDVSKYNFFRNEYKCD